MLTVTASGGLVIYSTGPLRDENYQPERRLESNRSPPRQPDVLPLLISLRRDPRRESRRRFREPTERHVHAPYSTSPVQRA